MRTRLHHVLLAAVLTVGLTTAGPAGAANYIAAQTRPQQNSWAKAEGSDPPVSYNSYEAGFYGAWWTYATAHRGTLTNQTGTSKGVPWNFRGYAQYRFDDVVFTCADGRSSVTYRARVALSASVLKDQGTGVPPASLNIGDPDCPWGSCANHWASASNTASWSTANGGSGPLAGLPAGTGFPTTVITGPGRTVSTGVPHAFSLSLSTYANTYAVPGNFRGARIIADASFPTDGPAFELPEGCTCNSVEGNIVDNVWRGVDLPPPTVTVSGTVNSECDGLLAGVMVNLVDAEGTSYSTVTDANGTYAFQNVPSSSNDGTIEIVAPEGYEQPDHAFFPLDVNITYDNTLICTTVDVAGSVSSDCDGPLEGVTVTLTDGDGGTQTTASAADGSYAFTGLRYDTDPGQVSVTLPGGYLAPAGSSAAVDLTAGGSHDFALTCVLVDVTGTVSSDCEGPLEGVTIALTDGNGGTQTTTSASDGSYAFTGVRYDTDPGQLSMTVPNGYLAPAGTGAAVDLTTGGTQDFALICALVDVTGTVSSDCSGAMAGVTVDLLDAEGDFHTTTTDAGGAYTFLDVPYSAAADAAEVSIAIPLGYEAISPGVLGAALTLDQDRTVDFSLGCLEPTGDPRSIGYWKHQANVWLSGRGHAQESSANMSTSYPNALFQHFHENSLNGIQVAGVTYILSGGTHVPIDLETIQSTLTVNKGGTMLDRAKQHYLALLLNVASGKIGTATIVSADGATASQALQQIAAYILDGLPGNDGTAKDIGEIINNAETVPAGMIDLDIASIAYRRGPENGSVLLGATPSPFRSTTAIRFRLDAPGEATVDVFDAMGRLVRNLHDGWTDAGSHEVVWSGDDASGSRAVSGVYYIRLVSGGRSLIGTAILVR